MLVLGSVCMGSGLVELLLNNDTVVVHHSTQKHRMCVNAAATKLDPKILKSRGDVGVPRVPKKPV